jgi:hypothetical protein
LEGKVTDQEGGILPGTTITTWRLAIDFILAPSTIQQEVTVTAKAPEFISRSSEQTTLLFVGYKHERA